MEPLFENVYVRDEKVLKEYLGWMLMRRPIDYFLYIVAGVYFVESVVMWFWLEYFNPFIWILLAVVAALKVIGWHRSVKLTLQRDLELNGGEPVQLEIAVTEDAIRAQTRQDAPEILFSSIKKVTQTKNLIILISKARLAFVLTRDGFTRGTADEFLKFLRDKGLKVKGK